MSSLTLIQLVSEQTVQNLLPILALRPARVIQVCSAREGLGRKTTQVQAAAATAGISPEFREESLPSISPSPDEVLEKFKSLLAQNPGCIANITGGTKLMSLGAYLGVRESDVPILYCDTQQRTFVSLGRSPLPERASFEGAVNALNTRILLAAHGLGPGSWKARQMTDEWRAYGRRAAAARDQFSRDAFSKFMRALQDHFLKENSPAGYKAQSPEEEEFLNAAVDANILCRDSELDDLEMAFNDNATSRGIFFSDARGRKAREKVHRQLTGEWLEIYAYGLIEANPRFVDPLWSVQPVRSEGDFGETDILCFDRQNVGLLLVSCKASLPSLEHFEATRHRAESFGGSHVQAVLCVSNPSPERLPETRRWARSQRVRLLAGDTEIRGFFAPATTPDSLSPTDAHVPPQPGPQTLNFAQ